uniref:Uncharacterized protein n=1 Tax=viral metagenome TaxID=1070528 RepID=A0A6M3LKB5_9ZZZZ
MKRILLTGYKDNLIYEIYDLPYKKTKRGYFLLFINEKIDTLLLNCDRVEMNLISKEVINTCNCELHATPMIATY